MIPYDKLKSLSGSEKYLEPRLSFAILDLVTMEIKDNQATNI